MNKNFAEMGVHGLVRLALSVALSAVLVLVPMRASALNTDNTDGPATKSSYTASSGNTGSNGFHNHRGVGGWTEWESAQSALTISPQYAYRPYSVSSADGYGPASKGSYFGTVNQTGLDNAVDTNSEIKSTSVTGTVSDDTWGFKVSGGTGVQEEGKFGVIVENARVNVDGQLNPILLDVQITCTSYIVDKDIVYDTDKYDSYHSYIAIGKGTKSGSGYIGDPSPEIVLIGVKEAKFKYEFFLAGTGTKYPMKSNITYNDIDDHQYVAVADSAAKGIALAPKTLLDYGFSSSMHIVYANFDAVSGAGSLAAFGIAFDTGNSGSLTLTFGNDESSVSDGASKAEKVHAFDYAYFGGGAYSMWNYDPIVPYPFKVVTDSDEIEVTHDTLLDGNETFRYLVNQPVPSGLAEADYFKSFVMSDSIDSCLEVTRVRVINIKGGSRSVRAEWDSTNGVVDNEWFDITVSGSNAVAATAKASALKDADFYGGSARDNTVKQLEIRVRWRPGMTDAEKLAHGHRITDPADGWRVKNRGTVTIDGSARDTNEVVTDYFPPEKQVSDSDESLTQKNTLTNANEPFWYNISQYVPAKADADEKYTAMKFTDTIEECLRITDIKVLRDGGTDVTAQFTDGTSGNNVAVTANAASLTQASFYGHTYTVRISVKLRTDVTESVLRAHGHYVDADRYLKYDNKAAVGINDRPEVATDATETKVPVPDLEIEKTVDRYENQVGDVYRYTIKVKHSPSSPGDAVNVRIWDNDIPQGVTISGLTLAGLSTPNKTLTPTSGGFELVVDVLKLTETAEIRFDCEADKSHNGTIITNTAFESSFSDTSGDWTQPKSDDAEVYINSPKLNVEKAAQTDDGKIEKGDEIHYKVVITNVNPGTFMRDCIFYDEITQAGIRIIPGSITVMNSSNRLITGDCDITVSGGTLSIESAEPLNLAYEGMNVPPKELGRDVSFPPVLTDYANLPLEDRITVAYSVNVFNPSLVEGDIVNTFVSPSRPNTNSELIKQDDHIPSGGDFATHSAIVAEEEQELPVLPTAPIPEVSKAASEPPVATAAPLTVATVITVAAADDEDDEHRPLPRDWARGKGSPDTGDDFDPRSVAVIMACAGVLTLIMLIRRRRT